MEGNNIKIILGDNSTITRDVDFCAQEDNTEIKIGKDCMISNTIIFRTSDSHPIYSLESKERINNPKNIVIGNHVWIAPNVKIMKGATIGDNCIIGSDTSISKEFGNNMLICGRPASVKKRNVLWTRDALF